MAKVELSTPDVLMQIRYERLAQTATTAPLRCAQLRLEPRQRGRLTSVRAAKASTNEHCEPKALLAPLCPLPQSPLARVSCPERSGSGVGLYRNGGASRMDCRGLGRQASIDPPGCGQIGLVDAIRGEPASAREPRAATLYSVGPVWARTMQQPCASEARLRGSGPF